MLAAANAPFILVRWSARRLCQRESCSEQTIRRLAARCRSIARRRRETGCSPPRTLRSSFFVGLLGGFASENLLQRVPPALQHSDQRGKSHHNQFPEFREQAGLGRDGRGTACYQRRQSVLGHLVAGAKVGIGAAG